MQKRHFIIFVSIFVFIWNPPPGLTSKAKFIPTEFTSSWLAGVMARIIEFSFSMCGRMMSVTHFSMSDCCPSSGFLVIPGKSTSVRLEYRVECMFRMIGLSMISCKWIKQKILSTHLWGISRPQPCHSLSLYSYRRWFPLVLDESQWILLLFYYLLIILS
jgi:hypothetical protein